VPRRAAGAVAGVKRATAPAKRSARPRSRAKSRAGAAALRARREWPALPWPAVLGLILLATAWLQRAALRAPFFADDFLFLDQVRNRPLWAALTAPDPIGNFVRPVGRQLHFWLLAHAGGESPVVFHAANLTLFLGVITLLFLVTRRLAGTVAAAIAAAFVALHYAADVPLLWASGSQDLLALVGALGTLALFLSGRRALAALALLAGLLSKETVLLTPLVAALAARRHGEPWRSSLMRAWPLGLAVAAWAALWGATMLRSPGAREAVSWNPAGVAAAFVHLLQVALGIEWRTGGAMRFLSLWPPLVPLALALAAVAFATKDQRPGADTAAPTGFPPVALGLVWALLGAVPVTAVAPVWSSYYYLFALCGVGLALGAGLAARPREPALVVLALLAWGSENGRRLDEFITAPDAWSRQSHVNRRYIERATSIVERYLRQLRTARPTLPPRSTVFFGGLPAFTGFQAGDGPLLRWAYRDSSLRSYYLMELTAERYRRGPAFAFVVTHDTLGEMKFDRERLRVFAMMALVSDRPRLALDVLELPGALSPTDRFVPYWRAWLRWALGDTAGARVELQRLGMTLDAGPTPEIPETVRLLAAGDTVAARTLMSEAVGRHALDPLAHAMLGGLLVNDSEHEMDAAVEAYAATLLAPQVGRYWWLMGYVQSKALRYDESRRSLERFFALGGGYPEENEQAQRLLDWLRNHGPGGAAVQQSLHEKGAPPR
jgi:hypothetical protein